jgi:cytochrome c6
VSSILRTLLKLVLAVLLIAAPLAACPAAAQAASAGPDGARLFENHCVGCHLHGGNVVRRGRTLKLAVLERNGIDGPAAIARIAAEGIGRMSGYAGPLGEGGPEAVGAWVWEQAEAGWPPT